MNVNNLATTLTTIFALATGTGIANAAEPARAVAKADVTKSATENFNDHAKGIVFQRNLNRDIQNEPLLIKESNGRYLVHEASGIFGGLNGDGVGNLKSYNKDELVKEHGPLANIRTYEQYKADADILAKTPALAPKLSDNAIDMGTRIKDIQSDMKAAGETFLPSAPRQKLAPQN